MEKSLTIPKGLINGSTVETVVLLSKKFEEPKTYFNVGVRPRTTTGSRTERRTEEVLNL